jgi:hypothetical protein
MGIAARTGFSYSIAPKPGGSNSGRQQEAEMIEQVAVRVILIAIGIVMEMGKNVNNQHAPVRKEERSIYEYHGIFKRGMFHFLLILQKADQAAQKDYQEARPQNQHDNLISARMKKE